MQCDRDKLTGSKVKRKYLFPQGTSSCPSIRPSLDCLASAFLTHQPHPTSCRLCSFITWEELSVFLSLSIGSPGLISQKRLDSVRKNWGF